MPKIFLFLWIHNLWHFLFKLTFRRRLPKIQRRDSWETRCCKRENVLLHKLSGLCRGNKKRVWLEKRIRSRKELDNERKRFVLAFWKKILGSKTPSKKCAGQEPKKIERHYFFRLLFAKNWQTKPTFSAQKISVLCFRQKTPTPRNKKLTCVSMKFTHLVLLPTTDFFKIIQTWTFFPWHTWGSLISLENLKIKHQNPEII